MSEPRVVAWMPGEPSVRVMARATAESAARGARLRVLSLVAPPAQWSSWQQAALSLGVEARWQVVAALSTAGRAAHGPLHELAAATLVVTDAAGLREPGATALAPGSLVGRTDVYVVAPGSGASASRMHEPAVVVGVSDDPGDRHLVGVAGLEAGLRHRHLVVLHARPRGLGDSDHTMEHRWMDALPSAAGSTPRSSLAPRVVVTLRPVVDALRDHVDREDVLVLGVRQGCDPEEDPVVGTLLAAPPCDLLLTSRPELPAGDRHDDRQAAGHPAGPGEPSGAEPVSGVSGAEPVERSSAWEHLTA